MTKLFIFDLEGTTGIYNQGSAPHVNNTIRLRPGFRETVSSFREKDVPCAIATRAPRRFTEEILANLRKYGINWPGAVFTQEDVEIKRLLPYKDLSKVYARVGISSPSREAVVLGDLLRFKPEESYTREDYLHFDFQGNPEVLSSNFSLNDHPFPEQGESPVYAVLPQPWTTFDDGGKAVSLDLGYVLEQLESMYDAGRNDFSDGFKQLQQLGLTRNAPVDVPVEDGKMAVKKLGREHRQRYLIMKGHEENWKPLEVLF